MNKSIFPNILTASNLAFGVIGITLAAKGYPTYAAICVILSLVADGLDGRVARALGVSGPLGRELDSLSDVVGFGVAPAFILFAKELTNLSWLGYVPLIIFACLGAARLARFNIMTEEVHGYFQGLPIPAAGCFAATYVLSGVMVPQWLLIILMIVVAGLMVSNVKYPDFKGSSAITINKPIVALVIILAIAGAICNWHAIPVLVFAAYILFGVLNSAWNAFKTLA